MARQLALLEGLPRRPRRVLMHVIDAGGGEGGENIVVCKCNRCGYESPWLVVATVTEAKRGLPCPNCNPAEAA